MYENGYELITDLIAGILIGLFVTLVIEGLCK